MELRGAANWNRFGEQFGADVVAAHTPREALAEMGRGEYDLVLVNRLLDGGGSGLDFITRLKSNQSSGRVPVMLVSDRADAQREAVASGALPTGSHASSPNVCTICGCL